VGSNKIETNNRFWRVKQIVIQVKIQSGAFF